ncbi:LLM class F420-dependent oxidoreductase [Mycobacterium asiaticum]|uniref:LLM class F420-dependent oxidoreductase n=1 Tax=Mycobacterium asiaticum TaxID=1790 RepID=UPI00056A9402|nr:LLM class F420-dependent oxidoreductase [Mycobacterium asiaticum]ORA15029.1 LLM class F420-dependent oxidoreductase [Mycobacterium asiaticum DSM 44297]
MTSPRATRVAVQLCPGGTPSYAAWRQAVLDAEAMGADVVFGYDHFHKPFVENQDGVPRLLPEQHDVNHFEGWTALATWGELTTRVEIGLLVSGIGYRNPDLLADMARTVDHISGGRLILGLGSGWYEKDYTSYGYAYPTAGDRLRLFVDGLARIENRLARLIPPPLREIPILIGGPGLDNSLPLVAGFADIWHTVEPIDEFRRRDEQLKWYAEAAQRDDAAIERAVPWTGPNEADLYRKEGVTLFTAEIRPTEKGYDLSTLGEMIAWRDGVPLRS